MIIRIPGEAGCDARLETVQKERTGPVSGFNVYSAALECRENRQLRGGKQVGKIRITYGLPSP